MSYFFLHNAWHAMHDSAFWVHIILKQQATHEKANISLVRDLHPYNTHISTRQKSRKPDIHRFSTLLLWT